MNTPPIKIKVYQAIGVFLWSIVSGLLAYQNPPVSFAEFGIWLWQPSLNGILMALGVLGINAALRPRN